MMWECECGNIEYNPTPPEECPKCLRIDSFTNLPEEILDERAKERDLALESPSLPMLVKPKKPRSKHGKSKTRRRK